MKREDQIKKAINTLDKKIIALEKRVLESMPMGSGISIPGLNP
jgi:hypothetical protein